MVEKEKPPQNIDVKEVFLDTKQKKSHSESSSSSSEEDEQNQLAAEVHEPKIQEISYVPNNEAIVIRQAEPLKMCTPIIDKLGSVDLLSHFTIVKCDSWT